MSFLKSGSATSVPSRTPLNSSQTGKKRPRPDANAPVYSQPANTSSGTQTWTRITFAVDYLRKDNKAKTYDNIFEFLSIQEPDTPGGLPKLVPKRGQIWYVLREILRQHPKVEYDPTGFNGVGSYRYRPPHNVRSAEQLKGLLQRQTSSVGIKVSELKDGWPGAVEAVNELHKNGEVLVTRHYKTGQPLLVWQNDPSLSHNIDAEFRSMFLSIPIPANPDDMRSRLEAAGLKPVSAPRDVKPLNNQPQKKKKKAPRKGMKTSNTHMLNVFRDYSDKKK